MSTPRRAAGERRASQRPPRSHARPGRRSWTAIVAINIGLVVLLLLLAEGAARVFAPRSMQGLFNDPQVFIRKRPFIVPHPTRGFQLAPGYAQNDIHINSAGLRGPELPADAASRPKILAMGESSTYGWGVGDADSYPAQLQQILDSSATPPVPLVLNAGVPSYTSPQVAAYLQELLPRYQPRAVLLNVMWNDALFACIPNWFPDYLLKQQPAAWRQFLLRHSGLYRALALDSGPQETTGPVHNDKAVRYYADNLTAMARACKSQHVPLVIVRPSVDPAHVPADGMKIGRRTIPKAAFLALLKDFQTAQEQVAASEGVPIVTHRLANGDAAQTAMFIDPVHLNGAGNQALAADLAAALSEAKLVDRSVAAP